MHCEYGSEYICPMSSSHSKVEGNAGIKGKVERTKSKCPYMERNGWSKKDKERHFSHLSEKYNKLTLNVVAWERPNGLTDSSGQKFKHGTVKWVAFGPDVWELVRRSLRNKVRIFRNAFTPISGHDSSYQWGFLAWLTGYNHIRLLYLAWAMDKAWLPFKHEYPILREQVWQTKATSVWWLSN